MQKLLLKIYLLIGLCFLLIPTVKGQTYVDVNYFKGSIVAHKKEIVPFITGNPEGFMLSWNKKTYGSKQWHGLYNYPDYGISMSYQHLKNPILGENIGLYAHYSFYIFKRQLMLRVGQGIAATNQPYSVNKKNIAFGSKLLSGQYFMAQYKKTNLLSNWGVQAGLLFLHFSNANAKSPNAGLNTTALTVGVNYDLNKNEPAISPEKPILPVDKTINFNLLFKTGMSTLDILDTGQHAFYIASAFIGKRLNIKSGLQLGAEAFFANYLKTYIKLVHPIKEGVEADDDYRRIGVFGGHELFMGKTSLVTQVGYYVYYPFPFVDRVYLRTSIKHSFKNIFISLAIKTHGIKAEAMEFGVGYKF